jgi:hypothetical protein
MHPCCWHNLFQTLAQLVPALALVGVAGKKFFTAFGLFWKLPAKKVSPLTESKVLQSSSSQFATDSHCSCDKELAR